MKKRHKNYFQPTEEQRRIVAILSGFNVNQDEICKLIPGCNGNKRISKITLHRHFKTELQTGNIALKELIARKFVDALTRATPSQTTTGQRCPSRQNTNAHPLVPCGKSRLKVRTGWAEFGLSHAPRLFREGRRVEFYSRRFYPFHPRSPIMAEHSIRRG